MDLLATLANLSDSIERKVRAYMTALWPAEDPDNSITYREWERRRDQLRQLVDERLREISRKLDGT